MDAGLWVFRRRPRRSLRDERPTAGDLRFPAPMVGPAVSRNPASLLSARQHHWNGRLLDRRTMDATRYVLLPAGIASGAPGSPDRQMDQPPGKRERVPQVGLRGIGRSWPLAVDSGDQETGVMSGVSCPTFSFGCPIQARFWLAWTTGRRPRPRSHHRTPTAKQLTSVAISTNTFPPSSKSGCPSFKLGSVRMLCRKTRAAAGNTR